MIGYVTLGTNDLARAASFYDAIAAELGCRRVLDNEQFIAWGPPDGSPGVGITVPYDGNVASAGNGTMVALEAEDRAQVDRIHALALSLGAADEGGPAERFTGFYAAYFRDLDGNKLNAFMMG